MTIEVGTAPDPSERARTSTPGNLRRSPLAIAGLGWLAIVVLACFGASALALPDPLQQHISATLQLPSAAHLLGTDELGRDVLSRLLFGGRDALVGAVEATLIALVVGVPLGVIAGYAGGWVDALAARFADLLFSLPGIVVLLAVSAVFGNSTVIAMATLGVILSAAYIRLARASTLAVRNELYVDAARVSGISSPAIVFRHVLPNVLGQVIVQSSLTLGAAFLVQAGLGFLGLGPTPPAPTWGGMIADASTYLIQQPWLMVPPGIVLVLTILSVNVIADALRDSDSGRQQASLLRQAPATSTSPVPSAAVADELLRIDGLEVGFPSSTAPVVCDVSLVVRRGEIVGLVGESGSGKTMTALAVLGLLPYPGHISRGSIVFDGANLAALPERQLSKLRGSRIGMISQEPMVALDPSFTVASQLTAPLRRHRGLSRNAARDTARALLLRVGIRRVDAVMRSYPHELSGGMAQRVAIAIALAGEPDLLIADEPTTALDVTVQVGILQLLRSLRDEAGMTIILVTHDLGVVADLCDRAVVMQGGSVVESAQVDDLFAHPQHPYTQALLHATPSLVGPILPREAQ